jgi:hypothetical protein
VSRIAITGDVGGWTHRLDEAIVSLGGDPEAGTPPAKLPVVQGGDLVTRVPKSKGALALVDRRLVWAPSRCTGEGLERLLRRVFSCVFQGYVRPV